MAAAKNSVTLRLGSEGSEAVAQKLREIGETATREFTKAGREAESAAKKLDAMTRQFDALSNSQSKLTRYETLLGMQGGPANDAQLRALDNLRRRNEEAAKAVNDNAKAAGLAKHEWLNFGRQVQDSATMIAMGSSPMQVLTSQGAQLYDVLAGSKGGLKGGLKDVGAAALGLATSPLTILAAGAAATGYAFYQWSKQTDALTVSLNGLGRQSNMTVSEVSRLSETAAARASISNASARGLAGQFLSAGVPGASLGGAIGLTNDFSRRMGLSLEDASTTLSSALADPARGADELAKKFGLVTYAQREQIKQLQAVGDKSGASARLLEILAERIARMDDPTSRFTKLLDRIGASLSNSLDAWGELLTDGPSAYFSGSAKAAREARARQEAERNAAEFAASAAQERAADLQKLRDDNALAVREIQARTFEERASVAMEKARVAAMRESNDAVKASIAAENERSRLLAESARKARDTLRAATDQASLSGLSPLDRRLAEIDIKYRDLNSELVPTAAAPMIREFDGAGRAARDLANALTDSAARISGDRQAPLAPIGIRAAARGRGAAPYQDIISAEGTDKFGDPYNASLGYLRAPKPLTKMTMAEALAWGEHIRKGTAIGRRFNSSAKGAFQIVNSTQRLAMQGLGFGPSDLFDEAHQRAMADWIFQNQGIGAWEGFKRTGRRGIGVIDVARRPRNDNGEDNAAYLARARQTEIDTAIREARMQPQEEFSRQLQEQEKLLERRIDLLGRDQHEIDYSTKRQELMNEALRQTKDILPEQQAFIDRNAEAWASYQQRLREVDEGQKRLVDTLDTVRSTAGEALGGFISDLRRGASEGEALRNVLDRVLDRMLSLAIDQTITGLFGGMGKTGGGLFGGLFGNLFKGIFGFESGGIMTSRGPLPLRTYSGGGIANSPQLAVFGEGSVPEAYVPVPSGRIPVNLRVAGGQMAAPAPAPSGPTRVVVEDHRGDIAVSSYMTRDEFRIAIRAYDQQARRGVLDTVQDAQRRAG